MAEVARLTIDVRANSGRAIAQLNALNTSVNRASQNMRAMSTQMSRASRNMQQVADRTRDAARGMRDLDRSSRRSRGGLSGLMGASGGAASGLGGFARAAGNAGRSSSRMARLVQLGAAGITAMFPVITASLGVLGGLTSALTLAGAAGGIFGLALAGAARSAMGGFQAAADAVKDAKNAVKAAKGDALATAVANDRLAEAQRNLNQAAQEYTPVARGFVKSMGFMKDEYSDFIVATQKDTLLPAGLAVRALGRSFEHLIPVVKAVSPLAMDIAVAFNRWVTDGRLDAWVNILVKKGVPILRDFVGLFRSLFKVFGALVVQFSGFGGQIIDTLRQGADQLARWAAGGGFSRFMEKVRAEGPMVIEFLKQFWETTKLLLQTMNLLGPLGLGLVTVMLKFINTLNPELVSAMVVAFLAWKAAIMAVTIVNGILAISNAVLGTSFLAVTGPIVLVIAGIAALVAAIVWIATKTTWFQTAWRYAWNFIKTVAIAAWNVVNAQIIQPFLRVFGPILGAALRFFVGMWRAAWNAIRVVGGAVWNWLYDNVIRPWIVVFTQVLPAAARLLRTLVGNAWQGMVGYLRVLWSFLFNNVIHPIWRFFTQVIPGYARTLRAHVGNAWQGMAAYVQRIWAWMVNNIFNRLHRFFTQTIPDAARYMGDRLVAAFRLARDGIRNVWNGLRNIVAAPVRFFIDTVYNNGLRNAWNETAGRIPGIPDLPKARGFASGGYTGNGGKYEPAGIVHKGEFVLRKKATKQLPSGALQHMNRTGQMPGYADGGLVGGIKKAAGWVKDKVKGAAGFAGDFAGSIAGKFRSGAAGLIQKMLKPIRTLLGKVSSNFKNSGDWGKSIVTSINSKIDSLIDWVRGKEEVESGNGFAPAGPWKAGDGEKVRYHGALMNKRTMGMLKSAEKLFGSLFSITQGSYSTSVGASAGTHAGGGVLDIGQTSNKAIGSLRASGFAAWARTRAEGFSPHTHAVAVGDKTLSGAARNQVTAFNNGRNGLANNGPDTYVGEGGNVGGGAGRWRSTVIGVLRETGMYTKNNLNNVLKAINKESGGNPNAVNNWDSNARAGRASRGLLQTIPSTFNAYAGKHRSKGITNPYANIYAAVRYAKSRYGSGWSARMARPGGYATGVNNAPRGLAWVGENGPELMNFKGGESVTPNRESMALAGSGGTVYNVTVNVNGANLSGAREIEDAVVVALNNAKRKGRRV